MFDWEQVLIIVLSIIGGLAAIGLVIGFVVMLIGYGV